MKLPSNYFDNLSTTKYKQYLKLLPQLKTEHAEIITSLIFTFAAITFFGIFAINPTLSTIVDLRRQLSDNEQVTQNLGEKIKNLSNLQQQYNTLAEELATVYDAIPTSANVPMLTGQLGSIAKASRIQISDYHVAEVQLTLPKTLRNDYGSFVFSFEGSGNYKDMQSFISSITKFNRLVTLDMISVQKDARTQELVLSVRGRGYFKK